MREDIGVWILAALISLILPSVILYLEPSFPVAVLGVYIIEVWIYANLFNNNAKYHRSLSIRDDLKKLYQLESD
jgi:hypothetical protein